ncbi:cysteinyl-tRNA synthetase, partial [Pancytospora epiphaga]
MEKLSVYNTLTKKNEEFIPNTPGKIKMYICGPTVYDSPHIGHARTYISFDVIRRILTEHFKYDVTMVMNITNIDDKIIKRANERGISCEELSDKYEDEFFTEMDKLGVRRPDFVTRVTEYVQECIDFITKLEANGLTYVSNGSVYFDLVAYKKKFAYNLLRPKTFQDEPTEASEDKKSREDFVLWKSSKDNEPTYESKWGPGRPGWHIECSAMSTAIFGSKLDIHAGGIDLAFPHHENEIAQCQGHSGKEWVNYFLHTGHLNIDGYKMSKSLKNFLTIGDILENNSANNLRMMFLQHLWNKDMSYDKEQLKHAESINKRIFNFLSNSESIIKKNHKRSLNALDLRIVASLEEHKEAVDSHFANNLNTAKALDEVLGLISTMNVHAQELHSDVVQAAYNFVMKIMSIFGIVRESVSSALNAQEGAMAEILNNYRYEVRMAVRQKSP